MQASDITGVDPTVALRLLAVARSIAPCLDSLTGDDAMTAVAIIQGVAAELPAPGSRTCPLTQSRNGTSIGFDAFASAWTAEGRGGATGPVWSHCRLVRRARRDIPGSGRGGEPVAGAAAVTAWGGYFYPHAVSVRRKQATGRHGCDVRPSGGPGGGSAG